MEQMMIQEVRNEGTTEILGIRVPKIEGGFGVGTKCVLAKTIAQLHNTETKFVNQLINNNIDEFEFGIDIIDLKTGNFEQPVLNGFGLTNAEIGNANNIYLLSEQGFMLLVGFMQTEQAKVIRKEMRRNYFTMREIVNSNEQLKAMALLKAIEGSNANERLNGLNQYTEIKVLEETTPLIQKIEIDKPKVNYATKVEENLATTMLVGDLAKLINEEGYKCSSHILFEKLREWKYVSAKRKGKSPVPLQRAIDEGYLKLVTTTSTTVNGALVQNSRCGVTGKGQVHIMNRFINELKQEQQNIFTEGFGA